MTSTNALHAIKEVLSRWRYSVLFVCVTVGFFLVSILSSNIDALVALAGKVSFSEYAKLVGGLIVGGMNNTHNFSTTLLIVLSLLIGVVIMLMVFKIKAQRSLKGAVSKSGTAGTLLGIALPVCAPCGIGLFSLIGLSGVVAWLPYQGTELGILSIVLLVYAINGLGKGIHTCKKCQVVLKA